MQLDETAKEARLSPFARLLLFVAVAGLVAGGGWLAVTGIAARVEAVDTMRKTAEDHAIATVNAMKPKALSNVVNLDLPGRLEPFARADLYARVSGYLANWKYDIGSSVKSGDVLAEIDAPDLDQQLFQSQSDLANAKVNAQLSEITNKRFQALAPGQSVSQQTIDEKAADFRAKQALVHSAQANVERLTALSQYKRVVAPFDGTVTARNTDVGHLINAGGSSGAALFTVSDTRKLRLFINLPQNYAPLVKVGTAASLNVPEHPGKAYQAKIEAMSGAVDAVTGTSRMQLIVDNTAGELLAGGYASVSLKLTTPQSALTIPASALIVDKNGLSVAVMGGDGTVRLKRVTVSRDLGKVIEIGTGIGADDLVIESPPDGLIEGDRVRQKEAKGPPST
jgi:membrane fusion protein, multidrug efflux system